MLCIIFFGPEAMCQSIQDDVHFLCDSLRLGRRFGTPGVVDAAFWAQHEFEAMGLETSVQHFRAAGKTGHNVQGLLKAPGSSKYIIVIANMDGVGDYEGVVYPGADANASGVAALMALARSMTGHGGKAPYGYATPRSLDKIMSRYKLDVPVSRDGLIYGGQVLPVNYVQPEEKKVFVMMPVPRKTQEEYVPGKWLGAGRPARNVLFVALDGHAEHSAGAAALWDSLSAQGIAKSDILMVVNLDTMGSNMAPPQRYWKDYLIILGGSRYEKAIASCNSGLGLHLYYDYYDSRSFTDMFYRRLGDQSVFVAAGVPSVMVTSGITMLTNKPGDVPSTLSFDLLERRVELIRRWLLKL